MRWLDGIPDSVDMSSSRDWEMVKVREAWCAAVHGVTELDTTQNSTEKGVKIHMVVFTCAELDNFHLNKRDGTAVHYGHVYF